MHTAHFYYSESDHCFYVAWYAKYNLQLHDYTYIQQGSLTQKYEAFRPLYFTWQDSSAGAMVGMITNNMGISGLYRIN